MMKNTIGLAVVLGLCAADVARAQTSLPTSQPNLLQIFREEVKPGRAAEHERVEVGWPAAFEKAKSPYYYLALVSLTGAPEAWFIAPFDSHKTLGESVKLERDNAILAAELSRLSRADADHLNSVRTIHAVARKDLSHGAYPDLAKQRYWEVTTFRVRPGRDADFAAAAKAYGEAVARTRASASYRVYQVVAGMPAATYLVFSSVPTLGGFDTMMSDDDTVMKGFTAEDQKVFQKFFTESLISSDTQRFELNPSMSYVSAEVRASDPAFWSPKKKPAAKTAPSPTQPGSGAAAKPGSR